MGRIREEKRRRKKIREEKESEERRMHVGEKVDLRPGGVRAVVGLQYLFGPASENPPMQQSSLARFFKQKKGKNQKKTPPQMEAQICIARAQDLQGNETYG